LDQHYLDGESLYWGGILGLSGIVRDFLQNRQDRSPRHKLGGCAVGIGRRTRDNLDNREVDSLPRASAGRQHFT
jgi:hypothetical protein